MRKSTISLLHPRQLEAIVAVARAGSMHAAARMLGVPQPALSRLVAASEKYLGVALFHRARSGTRATEVGERVIRQTTFALRALRSVAEVVREPMPVVRLGCIPRVMHVLVPHLLGRISSGEAHFQLHVSVGTSNELAEDLYAGRLDFVVARRPEVDVLGASELRAEKLYTERTVVVCARSNNRVPSSVCHVRDLVNLPWLLPKRGFYSRDLIDRIVATRGLPPIVPIIESNSFESSLSVVALTQFLAIAPEFAARRFEQLDLVRVVSTRPSLGASPIMLQYRPVQEEHPAFGPFRAATLAASRIIRAG